MYFVYILRCTDDSLYTGITTDPVRRFREHAGEAPNGAKFTHSHPPAAVEALWSCNDRSTASKLEYAVKKLTRAKKLRLIADKSALAELLGDESAKMYTRADLPAGLQGA
ncbi:putative endonuclease [Ruminococcus sp. YRD2003]|uniref:GIY-YIG nuclease family protein n=1 Tax=Ruminococcus sp. YRD2003 TaxID=1452313 RepID=UPI0008CAA2DB|nr:putative endonuclease [Ruminococcus flavefaciens]